jgi:predicted DNA-binding transcriptional regulator AlpA
MTDMAVTAQDLIGPREIAERCSVSRSTVDQWGFRKLLPKPDYTISGNPVWKAKTIERWAAKTGRPYSAAPVPPTGPE